MCAEELDDDYAMQEAELVMNIDSIQDKNVRGILILGGYFIAGISGLFTSVVKLYNEGNAIQKAKIYEMCKDDKQLCDVLKLQYDKEATCKVALGKIISLFGMKNRSHLQASLLPYLKKIGFIGI